MKTINKLKDNISKVAGSALLIGATVAAGGAAVAQDSGSSGDLTDYPAPFVNDDGEVDTSIVVGNNAEVGDSPVSTQDVIAATEIGGSLGNAAFTESSVSVSAGGVAGTWSAENGITLNRRNSNIYFGQATDSEETNLDEEDIPALQTATVQSEDNEEVEIEHDVTVGNRAQEFDTAGDLDDAVLHVNNPTGPSFGDALLEATVSFDSTMDFTAEETDSKDDNADEVLEDGDTIELFGQDFTYSADDSGEDELTLFGSTERVEVNTGESTTITVNGQEVSIEASYVEDGATGATITVDGQTESVEDGDTVGPNGNIRVTDIYRTGPDGQGRVAFSQGSDEVVITQDSVEVDGDTVDGVTVQVNGPAPNDGGGVFQTVDSIDFAFGAQDSDNDYIAAGEKYETPVFGLEFHYGGLNPDASTEEGTAGMFEIDAQDDDDVEFTFTAEGEETSVSLGEVDNSDNFDYGPDDGDGKVAQFEGEQVTDNDYLVLNSNEEAGLYEVTNVDDTDLEDADGNSDDETLSVTLNNVVTDESVEVSEDGLDLSSDPDTRTLSDQSIDGMDFEVTFSQGDTVSFERTVNDDGNTQAWPHLYTQSDAAVAIDAPGEIEPENLADVSSDFTGDVSGTTFDLSTTLTVSDQNNGFAVDAIRVTSIDGDGDTNVDFIEDTSDDAVEFGQSDLTDTASSIENVEIVNADGTGTIEVTDSAGTPTSTTFTTSEVSEDIDIPSTVTSNDATATVDYTASNYATAVDSESAFVQYDVEAENGNVDLANTDDQTGNGDASVSVAVIQPEDEDDNEEAYVVESRVEDDSSAVEVDYTNGGPNADRDEGDIEDGDVTAAYDYYGAYSEEDTSNSDQESFTLHMPAGQATAGMAVTGTDGELSSTSGGGGSAEAMSPTYSFANGVLDSEVGQGDRDQDMVLVGGPSVNSLVSELASENQTWTADEYTEGEALIQHIPDAFVDGEDVVIVAGFAAEDTRAAGEFLADYRNNEGDLEGNSQVVIDTQNQQVISSN